MIDDILINPGTEHLRRLTKRLQTVAKSRREQMGRITIAYQTVNPYNNQTVATFDDLTDAQVRNLLAQAQKTFESWSQTSYAERAAVCRRAAAIITERPDEFARLLTLQMGKPYGESLGGVARTADIFYLLRRERRGFPGARAPQHAQPGR